MSPFPDPPLSSGLPGRLCCPPWVESGSGLGDRRWARQGVRRPGTPYARRAARACNPSMPGLEGWPRPGGRGGCKEVGPWDESAGDTSLPGLICTVETVNNTRSLSPPPSRPMCSPLSSPRTHVDRALSPDSPWPSALDLGGPPSSGFLQSPRQPPVFPPEGALQPGNDGPVELAVLKEGRWGDRHRRAVTPAGPSLVVLPGGFRGGHLRVWKGLRHNNPPSGETEAEMAASSGGKSI